MEQSYLTNCTLSSNYGLDGDGGAIAAYDISYNSIQNSTFFNNTASSGGAIFATGNSILEINQSLILQNKAHFDGGAIQASNSISLTISNSELRYVPLSFPLLSSPS